MSRRGTRIRIELNCIIIWYRDKRKPTRFLHDTPDLSEPILFGQMLAALLLNGVSLDFFDSEAFIAMQHCASLVSGAEFERAFTRVQAGGLAYQADPVRKHLGETYEHSGGHGLYSDGPDRYFLETITRLYDLGSQPVYLVPLGQCDQGIHPPNFVRYRHDLARRRNSSRADCRCLARDATLSQPR